MTFSYSYAFCSKIAGILAWVPVIFTTSYAICMSCGNKHFHRSAPFHTRKLLTHIFFCILS